jgi:hypothetical protein
VVCGAHYDATSSHAPNIAPGADDNASGVAGILEIARILSQYEFKRSIIYCAFSAEEHGLIGSQNYVQECLSKEMNIVGYFNLDMTGYLTPENEISTILHYQKTAQPLADYYMNICNVYFPELSIETAQYDQGSDGYSFNKVGYMGIWTMENNKEFNPYYHTPNDIIGFGVNSPEQATLFTKTNFVCIATLAMYDQEMPISYAIPTNCFAEPKRLVNYNYIKVTWEVPENHPLPRIYNIYKDDVMLIQVSGTTHSDYLTDYDDHCYKVTAVYFENHESEPSNESCASVPVGITDVSTGSTNVRVYPNPTRGEFLITNYELGIRNMEMCKFENVKIFDIMGRKQQLSIVNCQLSIEHLPAGIYFIRICTENDVITRKVVKY